MTDLLRAFVRAVRVIVGAPRYEAYRAHVESHHPDRAPMSRTEFERHRLETRYSQPNRCC
jgi:uncharacterized short protein YbdD (DUF466 family)